MPRARNPNREKAFQIWQEHGGDITNRQIAEMIGENEKVVAVWKQRDKWNVVQQSDESCTTIEKGGTSPPMKQISWVEIESEYVTDVRRKPCTLRDLAEKHSIPLDTLKKHASANDWTGKRHRYGTTVAQKSAEKAADIISDDIAVVTARHFRITDRLFSIVEEALSDPDEFYRYVEVVNKGLNEGEEIRCETKGALNTARLGQVVGLAEKLQKMQRQTLKILDPKDEAKLDLELYKALPPDDDDPTEPDGYDAAMGGMTAEEVWGTDDTSSES